MFPSCTDELRLSINYEVMLRFQNAQMAAEAREIFGNTLRHCHRIEWAEWCRSRTFWARLKRRWAFFLLARIDPYVARKQWRALPN